MKDIYNSNPCGDIHVANWIISLKDKFEDNKGLIRSDKSKKDRQYNGQQKKDKKVDNDLQKTTQKTKVWVTRTSLKSGCELRFFGRVTSFCYTSDTRRITI